MKKIILLSLAVLLIGCDDSKNSDGSSKTTYSSCRISDSTAMTAVNRASDLNQCWSMTQGWGSGDKDLASEWCKARVNEYIAERYGLFYTHVIETTVASNFCPK